METRVDKYRDKDSKSSRVEKNQNLYKMIYSAYDDFENYKVPLEEKEIDLAHIKKSVSNRSEYKKAKDYGEFANKRVSRQDMDMDNDKNQDDSQVYDIKELLTKVKNDNNDDRVTEIKEEKYLDKLHLKNNVKTNLEKLKEEYEDVILDSEEEKKLSNTSNLSLEILSDLKSNEDTMVSPPMKMDEEEEDIPYKEIKHKEEVKEEDEDSFYSDMYKFKKKDFENEDEELDDELDDGNNSFLFKILIIISVVILFALIAIYLIGYFSK